MGVYSLDKATRAAFNAASNPERVKGDPMIRSKAQILRKYLGKWSRWAFKKSPDGTVAIELNRVPEALTIRATFTSQEVKKARTQIKRANTMSAKKANAARNLKRIEKTVEKAKKWVEPTNELNDLAGKVKKWEDGKAEVEITEEDDAADIEDIELDVLVLQATNGDEAAKNEILRRADDMAIGQERMAKLSQEGAWAELARQIDKLEKHYKEEKKQKEAEWTKSASLDHLVRCATDDDEEGAQTELSIRASDVGLHEDVVLSIIDKHGWDGLADQIKEIAVRFGRASARFGKPEDGEIMANSPPPEVQKKIREMAKNIKPEDIIPLSPIVPDHAASVKKPEEIIEVLNRFASHDAYFRWLSHDDVKLLNRLIATNKIRFNNLTASWQLT